ncbi:Ca-activated chloride channel family protein [Microbacterium sp. cf046]|uniref:vWA domain-containing protein n=1 Tax=Microbacterium sp. cf046 TaxID=1761803 RepID=UPI0008EAC84B|nr:substrate-binding domain-containing protein [Microbacterium sp. cf046]SFR92344.1 Ca-activated chloride channel family protein [Microbacterium sp. cf046]
MAKQNPDDRALADDAPGPRRGVARPTTEAPSAIELRRRQRRERRRRVVMWTSVAAIVVLVAAIGTVSTVIVSSLASSNTAASGGAPAPQPEEPIVFPADEPAAAAGAGPCISVPVLSSFENAEMVANLAAAYNAQPRDINGSCVTVTAARDKSGIAAEAAAAGFPALAADAKPLVWLPDAHTWLSLARANGGEAVVPADAESVATSDIVLAMPEPLAQAIGWDEKPPQWQDVFEAAGDADLWTDLGHSEWGAFKLGKTSPVVATSGEAAMFASFGTAEGSLDEITAESVADESVKDIVREHELATSHYMATPEHFLWHARQAEQTGSAADFLSAVIVDEKSVWDYNRGITSRDGVTRTAGDPPVEKLVPIYPADGFYAADNPAAVLTGDWVDANEAAAAADFVRYAVTAEGQQIVRDSGYRDLNRAPDAGVAEVAKLVADPAGALPLPDQDVVAAVNTAFPEVRKRAQVLFLVDVSGSMDEPISASETKLSAAKDAIALALDHFTAGDNVGLAAFAQAEGGVMVPGAVSPIADIGTSRDAFLAALGGLKSQGDTPLYQAVDTFAAQQAQSWSPDRITAVVVLSDGKNDTPTPTIGVDQMLANLGHLHHGGTPVLVFTLAYGADADVATLQSISSATGAHYYDATDPTKVSAVLGDLVTSF